MRSAISRRAFLTRASAGAMTIGALSTISGIASPVFAQTNPTTAETPEITLAEPLVVYVHNPAAGDVAFMVGTQEVTRHDPELVAQLLKLMG
ncbi:MAG TPA: hypothetical protein VHV31_04135 [Nitrolancea sp.]|nr:hypothetical protein [Nitrolancea sp.]